jgi:hypothetical protein
MELWAIKEDEKARRAAVQIRYLTQYSKVLLIRLILKVDVDELSLIKIRPPPAKS